MHADLPSNRSLELRPFVAADDAALLRWIGSAQELERFGGPSLRWPLSGDQLEAIRRTDGVSAWTAHLPGHPDEPVGHVEFVATGPRSGRLARVLVDPAQRGRGLGRALVAAAIERAERGGSLALNLKVFADNEPAVRIYTALGFKDQGRDPLDPRLRVLARNGPAATRERR
jgi:ribosomal protein S18 acetylase RimI-like enzyme